MIGGAASAEFPRVRVMDDAVLDLFVSGRVKSATFRALAERLERSDVIVHVEPSPRGSRSDVAGTLRFVATAGGYRYLRITIAAHLPRNRAVAMLGHELQHALEVADDPSVVDLAAFESLYRRIGDRCDGAGRLRRFDTEAARKVERRIARELREPAGGDLARR